MRKLFSLILFYPLILLYSQIEDINIQWNRESPDHFFSNALYEDGENTLPYITRKISWTEKGMLPLVSVKVHETTLMSHVALQNHVRPASG